MSSTPPDRKDSPGWPSVERRAGVKLRGLGRLKSLLGRPLRLERRGGQLHLVLDDRRGSAPADPALALQMLRTELSDRLLAPQHAHKAQVMRHLVCVHDELGRGGWAGVGSFPARVLSRALTQAEMLASEEASAPLAQVVACLRACVAAAESREAPSARTAQEATPEGPVVSELTHEEFAEMQRGWIDTVTSVLTLSPMPR